MKEVQAKIKLITSMTIFGTIGIFVRYIPLSSTIIALARGYIGMLFLILVVFLSGKKISFEAIKANWKPLVLSGAFIGVNWILLFEAYRYTTVATATLCYYLAPIFVIVVSPVLLKEKLPLRKVMCVVLALVGMVFVSGVLNPANGGNIQVKGLMLGVGAALFYASVVLTNKYLKNISAYDMTIVQLGVAATVLLPYAMITENVAKSSFKTEVILLLLLVGIVHTGVTYAMYFSTIQDLKAQTVAIFSYIDPIVAIILSAVVLRESIDIYSIIGAVLVLGSTFLSEIMEKNKE